MPSVADVNLFPAIGALYAIKKVGKRKVPCGNLFENVAFCFYFTTLVCYQPITGLDSVFKKASCIVLQLECYEMS